MSLHLYIFQQNPNGSKRINKIKPRMDTGDYKWQVTNLTLITKTTTKNDDDDKDKNDILYNNDARLFRTKPFTRNSDIR